MKATAISNVDRMKSLGDAAAIIMDARINSQNQAPVLAKLRRVSNYLETQQQEIMDWICAD